MNLKEIENNNRAAKSRRKIAGFSDKRWMEEIDWLIAEVKRLREELDERYLCPECGYTWSVEDDERLEGMIEDREGE